VTQVLKNDKQVLTPLIGLLYELVKAERNIDRKELGA